MKNGMAEVQPKTPSKPATAAAAAALYKTPAKKSKKTPEVMVKQPQNLSHYRQASDLWTELEVGTRAWNFIAIV